MKMFSQNKKNKELEVLIVKLSKLYNKTIQDTIDILSDFIEQNINEFASSETYVNKILIKRFKEKLEYTEKIKIKNQQLLEKEQNLEKQYNNELLQRQVLEEKIIKFNNQLNIVNEENIELKKNIKKTEKKIKIISFNNKNIKIDNYQNKNIDYKKHQLFLAIMTIIGILVAIFFILSEHKTH